MKDGINQEGRKKRKRKAKDENQQGSRQKKTTLDRKKNCVKVCPV